MTLYHYTTLNNFFSIWESKTLRFSYSKNTNDYYEREKAFVYDQGKFAEKKKVWGYLSFKTIRNLVSAELEKYRQISFCLDYSKKMPGYASPMMWGQYARSKKGGKWQNGDKLELESDKTFPSPSTAADFCIGSSNNGWLVWKDKDGQSLDAVYRKQLE